MSGIRHAATLAAALFIAGAAPAVAQQPTPGHVRGQIANAEDAPLPAASIELYAHRDSSLAAGAISDASGRFRIEGVRPGVYRLRVMFMGHKPHMQDLEVAAGAVGVDLGRIRLTESAVALDAIDATAQRGSVTLEVDRTVYQARQAAVAGGNATDVLRNVPGVDVDIDGKVSLRGSGSVAVQINGRSAPVQGDALVNFLKQLPASAIERVEVVPNPSARYDPEGMGGIINIVMQQNTAVGLSGGINLSVGTGDKYNGSGSLGYQAGRLSLLGSLGLNDDVRSSETYIFRSNDFAEVRSYYEQNTSGNLHNQGLTFNSTAEYRATRASTLAGGLTLNRLRGDLGLTNVFRNFDADRELTDASTQPSFLDQAVNILDASLAFRRVLTPAANEVNLELRLNRTDDRLLNVFGEATDRSGQRVRSAGDNFVLQTDAVRSILGMKVEAGQKLTLRTLDHGREPIGTAATDPADGSVYDERILAGYAQLSEDVGRLMLQGGLRVEHTTTELEARDTRLNDDYLSLFPSAAALYSLSPSQKLRLSYSRRIQRPNSRFMNPFPVLEDPRNVLLGNPRLRPEMTDAVELSFQQNGARGSLQVQPFMRRTSGPIRVMKTVAESGMATTTFRNLDHATTYGSDVVLTGRAGNRVNGMLSVSAFHLSTAGESELGVLSSETLSWNTRASLSWTISQQLNAQWTLFHRGPMNMEQGRVRPLTVTTFALQQKLFAERASLTLRVNDPLDVMRMSFTTSDDHHHQRSWRKIESRIVNLGFSWNVGQQPRIRRRTEQEEAAQIPIF